MIVEKTSCYKVKLEDYERKSIMQTMSVLRTFVTEMKSRDCDTYYCNGEFSYDITTLETMIKDLDSLLKLNEIWS